MNHDMEPVERKVQLTGGSTYTVSLPKEWASGQDIEPGSQVRLYSQGDQLVMTRGQNGPEDHPQTTTIDGNRQDPTTLALSVASAYVAGCDEVRVESIRESAQRRAIVRSIRGFVGLEVMTEDETSLVAKTMLDVGDLSPEQTLAQLERTTFEMHQQAIGAVIECDTEVGTQVARQDDDVDRLFALLSRGFQQSLVDPAVTMGDDRLSPFEYYMAARQLERIADHAEKIATVASRLDDEPPADSASNLADFGERSRAIGQRALSGLFEESAIDTSALGAVIADAETLLADLSAMDEQLYNQGLEDGYLLGLVVDSLVRTTQYGVNIAETGLQARHRNG